MPPGCWASLGFCIPHAGNSRAQHSGEATWGARVHRPTTKINKSSLGYRTAEVHRNETARIEGRRRKRTLLARDVKSEERISLEFQEKPVWGPRAASLESQVWTKHHEKPLPVLLLLSQCKHLCHRSPKGTMCVGGRLPAKSASETHCWNGGLVREACSHHASRHSPGSTSHKPRPGSFCRTRVWILRKKPRPCSSFKKPWRALGLDFLQ